MLKLIYKIIRILITIFVMMLIFLIILILLIKLIIMLKLIQILLLIKYMCVIFNNIYGCVILKINNKFKKKCLLNSIFKYCTQ